MNSTVKTNLDLNTFTGGRKDAIIFMQCWGEYLRAVDNIIDENWYDPRHIIEALSLGCRVYSTEFYQQNINLLQAAALITTSLWEQSVHWEKQRELWKRQWADVLRHADIAVLGIVVLICKGWEAMTNFTNTFLSAAYIDHKDRRGLPL